jgi:hypothetical protein
MKRIAFLLILFPALVFADEFRLTDLSGGIFSNASANKIPDNSAAFIQNLYTDIEPIVVERNGYIKRDNTVLGGTKAAYGSWSFIDSSGNEWYITYSSRTFYKNTLGQTPTAFGPSLTSNQIPDCANNLGRIWCVNGSDYLWWFDGTSTGAVTAAPLGTLIEPWRTRLSIAHITGAGSTIRISEDGDGESWSLGTLSTDPFAVQIGGANDGDYIRCLVGSYLDSMIIGRKNDLWALDGFSQDDYVTRNISDLIGCIEPRTPQEVDGELVFLSARGLEAMNTREIRNISEPIRNITDIITKNTANQRSNTQTTNTDWGAGSMENSVYLDTQTSNGDVQLTFPDPFISLRDGTSGTKKVWTEYQSGTVTGDISISNEEVVFQHDSGAGRLNLQSSYPFNDFSPGTTFFIRVSSFSTDAGNLSDFYMTFRSTAATSASNPDNEGFVLDFQSTTTGRMYLEQVRRSDTGVYFSTPTADWAVPANLTLWLSTSNYNLSVEGISVRAGTHTFTSGLKYLYLGYLEGSGSAGTLILDNFGVTPQTATFTSQLLSIGNLITSWSPVSISDSKTNGNISYQFGSTSTANLSSIANYTAIANAGVPTVSTNPYAAFKAYFSNTAATSSVKLSEFITTWNEGGVVPSPVSTVFDRRYWLSFTTNTTSNPQLDSIFVWQRNKSFTFFKGIYAASFVIWRDYLHFGNSNDTGYVYKFDFGDNDDGADIYSFILSKSYDFGQFYRDKEFSKSYLSYLSGSGTFSLSYDINRDGTTYSLGSASLSEETGQSLTKFWFPLTQLVRGREIQYTLTKTGTGSRLKLYDFATQYEVKEER